MRWLHVMSGVMWIGPALVFQFRADPDRAEDRAGRAPRRDHANIIAPNALFWFRYAALATVITGALVALMSGYLVQALTLRPGHIAIGIGMWLALIMAFNVWFVIWPNQQKVLGLVQATAGGEGRGRAHCDADIAHQYDAVDPDAVLHGGAAERRPLIGSPAAVRGVLLWKAP